MASWRVELAALGGPDTLLAFAEVPDGVLDLGSAHPSGLATFLAGRSTRLSSLFREPAALATARRSARAVRRTASRLTDEHGLPGSHLAMGMVVRAADGEHQAIAAPVLLAPVSLRPRGSTEVDHDVDLLGPARVNPSLARALAALGIHVDTDELLAQATGGQGFTPRPALQRLRLLMTGLAGVTVVDRTVIGTFVDLGAGLVGALDGSAPELEAHPVARALVAADAGAAGRRSARWSASSGDLASAQGGETVTALLLDPAQRAAIDSVRAGADVAVLAPSGTGATQVAAQLVVCAAEADRSVLVVAPRRGELDDVRVRLAEAGLPDLAAEPAADAGGPDADSSDAGGPDADSSDAGGPDAGSSDAGGPDAAAGGSRGGLAVALRTAQDLHAQVLAARRALHEVRDPWRTSKLDVLRRLQVPPETVPAQPLMTSATVARLAGPGLGRAAGLLTEAVELGVGRAGALPTPWSGATPDSQEAAAAALAAVRRLLGDPLLGDPLLGDPLSQARLQVDGVTAEAGLGSAGSVAGWGRRIDLLAGVAETLELFRAVIFERPVESMVAATATAQWRARNGVSMPAMRRRALRRQARETLRPGSHPQDLHASLARVQSQRLAWQQMSTGGGWPRVPAGLDLAARAYHAVCADLDALEPLLATSTFGGSLRELSLPGLAERLRLLDGDAETLSRLPRRAAAGAELAELGLVDVLRHLHRPRGAPTTAAEVAAELEQLWCRQVLEAMDAQDAGLAGDPGPSRSAWREVRRLRSASPAGPRATGTQPTATLVTALALPHRLPPGQRFDVVVLLDAGSFGLAEATLALVRASQVVVIGDPHSPRPLGAAGTQRADLLAAARTTLTTRALPRQHRVPRELVALAAAVEVDATGPDRTEDGEPASGAATGELAWSVPAPDPDRVAAFDVVPTSDGPDAEVAHVVQLVLEHARAGAGESLAVVAVDRAHARRVAGALQAELVEHPRLAGWFTSAHRSGFVVTDLEGAEAAARDHVVLTLGLAPPARRRTVDRFGRLDGPDGHLLLRRALRRAGHRLTVVSSVQAAQLDPHRPTTPGARSLLALLTRLETTAGARPREGHADAAPGPDPGPDPGPGPDTDPVLRLLVAALADRGARAATPSGAPGCTPDLVVDAPGGRVAVLWDGRPPAVVDSRVLDDEEHLEAALARAGWRLARLAARDVVDDPAAAAAQVLGAR